MPLRNARALTYRPQGVSDAADSTNAFPGAMAASADLIPSVHTRGMLVPRPAAFPFIDFGGRRGENIMIVGHRVYGIVTSQTIPGHSEPFLYDVDTQAFLPIDGITEGNTPISTPPTGNWIPPTSVPVGAFILFSHPGFTLPNAFGWLDLTGFRGEGVTGDTGFTGFAGVWGSAVWGSAIWGGTAAAGGLVIANLSKNVLLAGWRPGMLITDEAGQISPGTRISAISADGLAVSLSQPTLGAPVVADLLTVVGGSPDRPLWSAGNTNGFPLPGVAKAVSQFNGRAWFAVKSATPYTDALDPLQRTNANQVLTFDNGLDVTAFGTIPFNTQLGGIVQALLAFQADEAIQQITGDQATGNLAKNLLSEIGTLAPLSIVSTPDGILFVAPDGLRMVAKDGTVTPPIGAQGEGVALPFVNSVTPSRLCCSYNEDVYRCSVTYNVSVSGAATSSVNSSEFWYHLKAKSWSGPHSFPAALIAPLDLEQTRHGHLMFPLNAQGIWFSNTRPMLDSSYTENGRKLSWVYETSLLPDTEQMFMNAMNETTLMVSLAPDDELDVSMVDEAGTLLDHVRIRGFVPLAALWGSAIWGEGRWGGPSVPPAIWGSAIWGQSVWGAGVGGALLSQRLVPWDHEIVFKQARVIVSGPSSSAAAVGNLYMRWQQTGYTITDLSGASS